MRSIQENTYDSFQPSEEELSKLDPEVAQLAREGKIDWDRLTPSMLIGAVVLKDSGAPSGTRSITPEGQRPPGDLVGGPDTRPRWIKLRHRLGGGGLAEVFDAYDVVTKRMVAVKKLNEIQRFNPSQVEAFIREARVMARFEHPRIPRIDGLTQKDDELYFVMEKVGGTYKQLRDRMGKLTPAQLTRGLSQLLDVIEDAAARGIFHFDLKPDNIMMDDEGNIKLLDFGASSLAMDYQNNGGTFVGSPVYASRDQIVRDEALEGLGHPDAKNANWAAELHSLATVIYEMFTGDARFWKTTDGSMMQALGRIVDARDLTLEQVGRLTTAAANMGFDGGLIVSALRDAWKKNPQERLDIYPTPQSFGDRLAAAYIHN